ncbi:hypothetical protein FIU97_15215 [Roseivivax sp. THAF40]|uniref:hypothetical protein n=1 Tax=unclassified Roseivivax TaxID=2639302 RepID=UPI0012A7A976|nr:MULTISPECIES: hypothetical protein [unclassified Roseivivax]QFS84102.1 hypothetical protein FIV09_14805 [Roseivivax sp. THAF197b]QFT47929.1 hypothetical protein FIU97_15215 [Roseivivax sp. THAF40]
MKKVALLLAATLGLSACAEEVFTVEITVDPILAKDGTVVDYRPTVMAPVEED